MNGPQRTDEMMNWIAIRREQQQAMLAVFLDAQVPVVMAADIDDTATKGTSSMSRGRLVIVPSSNKDKRCWKIDRNGDLKRYDRDTDKPVRGNIWPKRILKTVPR